MSASNEVFDSTHDEAMPGYRIIDEFEGRVQLIGCEQNAKVRNKTVPTKVVKTEEQLNELRNKTPDNDFVQYVDKILKTVEQADKDASTLVVWTDGSCVFPDDILFQGEFTPDPSKVAGAWMVTKKGKQIALYSQKLGRATMYDGEMAALKGGMENAVRRAKKSTKMIRVFVDNVAAANAIVKPKLGPSMHFAVEACEHMRKFLSEDVERKIIIQWCPSHIGIKCNEEVDEEAGKAARKTDHPGFVSFARARSDISREANHDWDTLIKSGAEYMGHEFLKTDMAVKFGKVTCHAPTRRLPERPRKRPVPGPHPRS